MALNADKKPRKATVTRIHPTVIVRRPKSAKERAEQEPDRQHVEAPAEPQPELVLVPKKLKTGAKTAFIKANPDVPATELVEKGKKAGIPFTASYVYNVRGQGKKPGKKKTGKRSAASIAKQKATLAKKKRGAARTPKERLQAQSSSESIGALLETIAMSALEIKRRLSQLTF